MEAEESHGVKLLSPSLLQLRTAIESQEYKATL